MFYTCLNPRPLISHGLCRPNRDNRLNQGLWNLPFNLLHCEKHITGGYTPHLTFNILVQSNIFSVHQYKREYPERESVRIKVWELHKEGWGYTKIHRYLKKNGFEIGDSRTTVDSMIKKMKKREYILGLQDQIRKYEDFKIQYFRL